jgi:hypothetical protein
MEQKITIEKAITASARYLLLSNLFLLPFRIIMAKNSDWNTAITAAICRKLTP